MFSLRRTRSTVPNLDVRAQPVGRPRRRRWRRAWTRSAGVLTSPTKAPLVVAAVVHGELLTLRPFGWGDGLVARAAQRLTLVSRGLDPKSLVAPEVGHLELEDEYSSALRDYASGTPEGVARWIVHCSSAIAAAARIRRRSAKRSCGADPVGGWRHAGRMAERMHGRPAPPTETTISSANWDSRDLTGENHENVLFVDVDMTEATGVGAVFTECTFRGCGSTRPPIPMPRSSTARSSDVVSSTPRSRGASSCGSMFDACTYDLLKVKGGDWSFTGLPGADLRRASFMDVRMREADLTGARCAERRSAGSTCRARTFTGRSSPAVICAAVTSRQWTRPPPS